MAGQKSNIIKHSKGKKVEKLQPRLYKESLGFTQLLNETLNAIDDAEILGIYCYLASKPEEWEISKTQLRNHFKIGINKMDNIFTKLRAIGLLEMIPVKNDKGEIIRWDYYLKMRISTPMKSIGMESIAMENTPPINKEYINKEIINTTSEPEGSPSTSIDDFVQQVVDVYHDKLPEMPKIKIITDEVRRAIKTLIKEWPKIKGIDLTLEGIGRYFEGRKELTPWILLSYKTSQGNLKRSRLINIIRIDNVRKFYNGDYTND